MDSSISSVLRIGVFYDGHYFYNVNNYYAYSHERRSRISIDGLHSFIRQKASDMTGINLKLCQIVDAHYFRGRLPAKEADSRNKLLAERTFDDILMSENVVTHYMPMQKTGEGKWQEKGVDVSLALEAYELAYYKKFDVFVLIASDGDYVPLVRKLNSLCSRIMLVSWDFKHKDENNVERETKTSQRLIDEVTYPIAMQQLIDDPKLKNSPLINQLFWKNQQALESKAAESAGPESDAYFGSEAEEESVILSLKEGFGFIRKLPNNVFFHWTSLENCDFNELRDGMRVRFVTQVTDEGRVQAKRVWVKKQEGAAE